MPHPLWAGQNGLTANGPEYWKEYSKCLKKRPFKPLVVQNIKQPFVFMILLNFNVRGAVAGYLCQNFFNAPSYSNKLFFAVWVYFNRSNQNSHHRSH
jgi:hypothetical protein